MPDPLAENRTRHLEEMVERDPATALYLPLAERLREEGRVEEAIRLCEARKNRPGHGVGDAIVLGRCYLADGRLNEARSSFESALSLDRENVSALKALAGILAHEGRHARAIDLYRAVCRVDPGDLESQNALSQITSGEYADVLPADVSVGQGDLGWQPVRLPREEEHLSDLGLGLRTLEALGEAQAPAAAEPTRESAGSFGELSLEELDRATSRVAAARRDAAPADEVPLPDVPEVLDIGEEISAEPVDRREPVEAQGVRRVETPPPAPHARSAAPSEAVAGTPADAALPAAEPPATSAGNRGAFEDWLRRLGGGS